MRAYGPRSTTQHIPILNYSTPTKKNEIIIRAKRVSNCYMQEKKGKLTKSGIPGWFLNKIGYLFFRDGARLRTSAKRLQNAFWRLNPLRLVCAQHPKPFFRCSTPQNSANDGAQKVLSTNNPILFRNTPGITQHNPRFRYVLQLRCHP